MKASKLSRRKFARVQVHLQARFRILKAEDVGSAQDEILEAPSMWAPYGESALEKLSSGIGSSSEGLLARAVLDVSPPLGNDMESSALRVAPVSRRAVAGR